MRRFTTIAAVKIAITEAQKADPRDFHDLHHCATCGGRKEEHLDRQKCPPFSQWGRVKPFPKWPKTIKDEAKAGALFDKRIKAYWTANDSFFRPVV